VLIQEKWYPLGLKTTSLLELVKFSESFEQAGSGTDNFFHVLSGGSSGKPWHVLDYPGGTVTVGLALELRTTLTMDASAAVASFEVGRLGGEATKRGSGYLEEYKGMSGRFTPGRSTKSAPVGWLQRFCSGESLGSLGESPSSRRLTRSNHL